MFLLSHDESWRIMAELFVTKIKEEKVETLHDYVVEKGFEISKPAYTHFQAKSKGLAITVYTSLKIVVQGKAMKEFIEFYLEPEILLSPEYTHKTTMKMITQDLEPKIGSDEAGKGDFFGPLVVACVFVRNEADIQWLSQIGVQDSKKLSDTTIIALAKQIELKLPYERIVLRPEKYNELYDSFQNLNTLLAWSHGKIIRALANRTGATTVLIDKFASDYVIRKALEKSGEGAPLKLQLRTHAEEDLVVAAASILARASFVQELEKLGKTIPKELPKGASNIVLRVGKELVQEYGPKILSHIAKCHFSTYSKIVPPPLNN